jgi:hypothetical protein
MLFDLGEASEASPTNPTFTHTKKAQNVSAYTKRSIGCCGSPHELALIGVSNL